MEDIQKIISNSIDQINDKVLGVNFLEKIKYFLIENLKNIDLSFLNNSEKSSIFIKHLDLDLTINVKKYLSNQSNIKKIMHNDNLSIVLDGLKTIVVYDNSDLTLKSQLYLSKNTGIVLTDKTIIDENISKDTVLINISLDKKDEQIKK